jgi:hypothetical protein
MSQGEVARGPVRAVPVGSEGTHCPCVKNHNPNPVEDEWHHLVPTGRPFNGADVKANRRRTCGTQHGAVHVLLRLTLAARISGIPVDRSIRFSPFTRRLAGVALQALDAGQDRPIDVDAEWVEHTWRTP